MRVYFKISTFYMGLEQRERREIYESNTSYSGNHKYVLSFKIWK